jgi:hypothetical protein
MPDNNYKPGKAVDDRKTRFGKINAYVMSAGGWVVSVPGAELVTIECLPQSPIPQVLRERGYPVRPADPPEGQRILASALTERLTMTSSGGYEPMTEGSTKAVAEIRTHAGIVRVTRFSFGIG